MKFTIVRAGGKTEEREIYLKLKLKLDLIKAGGYDCTHPCDGPRKSPHFKQP